MSDFLKIFFILCGLVTAFVFGRNYGEKTITESKDYIKMRSNSAQTEATETEISALKAKFQNLLDSADLKKADEVLSKIMTIFLADLSLHISEEKEKDFAYGKAQCVPKSSLASVQRTNAPSAADKEEFVSAREEKKNEAKEARVNAKYKALEWTLINSQSDFEIRKNLKKIELKDLDTYLKDAPTTDIKKAEAFFGSYRGRVLDINQKDYGMLILELQAGKNDKSEDIIKGKMEFYRDGNRESNSTFTSTHFGYSPTGSPGTVYTLGSRQLHIYKIENTQKLAGYFYERLPNGTTKTIGTFVLNRVDQF